MKEITNQALEIQDVQTVVMPVGAKVLKVDLQYGKVVMWHLSDPKAQKQLRSVMLIGTGDEIPDQITERDYIGTIQTPNDFVVCHFFISPRGDLI